MKLYYGSLIDREKGLNVKCINFNTKVSKTKLIYKLDELWSGNKCIYIAMVGSDTCDYFITDSYLKVQDYFNNSEINTNYFVYEEKTYEDAFEYCKYHCEIHELGLN